MSVAITNLLAFSRPLPAPFDTLTNKKVKVTSVHSTGTEATLCCSVIKAVNAVCDCMKGLSQGAVGMIDHRSVAEYKSSMSPDEYHLVVYDKGSGNVLASVYDKNTEVMEIYTLNNRGRDGSAVLMAMFPVFMEDTEFSVEFVKYAEERAHGYTDLKLATDSMAILCDNVYRRIKDESCGMHVKITLDKSGNLMRISQTQLDSGAYMPTTVVAGEFTIFAQTGSVKIKPAEKDIDHNDFTGKYQINPHRKMSLAEQSLIPKLPEWYVIPREVEDICRHIQGTTDKVMPMRNFFLRGPSGTGKTRGAKAIAAGLNLPYMLYTCSAGTEIVDFIGTIFPETTSGTTGNAQLDQELEELKKMGGMTFDNVAQLMQLPEIDDMEYDPVCVFQNLTGTLDENASPQDCMKLIMEKVTDKIQQLSQRAEKSSGTGQAFTYVETDFIKALRYGYLVEIQEPSAILQPGVLPGLNSLLEQEGSITLPTGEIIKRHPDAVVVVTTNMNYEGCRRLNQSFMDRMSLVQDIELPAPEIMVQRAMRVTGCTDEYMVTQMVQVVLDMCDYMRKNSITDGTCGMRSLIDWIISTEITEDVYTSALYTVISKATADEEDREALICTVLEPIFAPGHLKTAV